MKGQDISLFAMISKNQDRMYVRKELTQMAILEVNHVKKVYKTRMGGDEVTALRDVHFTVEKGEFVAENPEAEKQRFLIFLPAWIARRLERY